MKSIKKGQLILLLLVAMAIMPSCSKNESGDFSPANIKNTFVDPANQNFTTNSMLFFTPNSNQHIQLISDFNNMVFPSDVSNNNFTGNIIPGSGTGGTDLSNGVFAGQIANWHYGEGRILTPGYEISGQQFLILNEGPILMSGAFNITLPPPPGIPGIYVDIMQFLGNGNTFNVSNTSAQITWELFWDVDMGDYHGYIEKLNDENADYDVEGSIIVNYYFVTQPVTVTGYSELYYDDPYDLQVISVNANLYFTPGWNALVDYIDDIYYDPEYDITYVEVHSSSIEPNGLNWYFREWK